ncbi:MAG: hypothetical protein CFE23_01420 [Flavobacterium sp. BFFFF1]|nr:MAG: hypothetical protein CFE23_01420 [Flavobacterium sp. BFFFF1]
MGHKTTGLTVLRFLFTGFSIVSKRDAQPDSELLHKDKIKKARRTGGFKTFVKYRKYDANPIFAENRLS